MSENQSFKMKMNFHNPEKPKRIIRIIDSKNRLCEKTGIMNFRMGMQI